MTPDTFARRRGAVCESLRAAGHDALLVSTPANIRYLCGFSGSSGLLLVAPDTSVLVTDFRYREQSEAETGGSVRVEIIQRDPWDAAVRQAYRLGFGSIGFEGGQVSERQGASLRARRKARFRPVEDLVSRQREVKDPDELVLLREAAAIAEAALEEIIPFIAVGKRELDVAAELERALRVRGSEWHPFETIVASGPRSALPHARTSERTIEPGDFLLMDFGATWRGYCSDMTRTFVMGRADERQTAMYELVRDAQRRALDGMRAGMTGAEVDQLARGLIGERGFADAFGHSLGHGIGLDVHEEPRLSSANDSVLPNGCVVTVEPGVYFPGWGGVRIEDDVHLTASGPERLTHGSTELLELK